MKPIVHRVSHRIRNYLASRYDLRHLKAFAFAIALMSCLSLGLIMLFSLFALALHSSLGMTYTEINLIVSLSAIGMYLCLPGLGYLADCHGPALLSLISIWAFCPAYFVNLTLVEAIEKNPRLSLGPLSVVIMAISFCFIGLATSSLYFSSLLTCAKVYPSYRTLAISLPVTCYGVSSLVGSQLLKLQYFHKESGVLDLYIVFRFFSALYFVVGILNFVSNSIVSLEQEVIFGDQEPLLSSSELSSLQCSENATEEALTPQRSMIEPVDHHERYIRFLKDRSAWLFLVSFFFCVGPMESFQNNLGLIIASTTGNSAHLENQVSALAALSTAIRLLVGVAADYVSSPVRKYPISKVTILIILALIGVIGQLGPIFNMDFTLVSILNGVTYGGVFTTYPTIITSIWGVDIMGSTWGSFMVAPALGSISFSLLHGELMDICPSDVGVGGNNGCLNEYFRITSFSLVASIICMIIVWRFIWLKRGLTNL